MDHPNRPVSIRLQLSFDSNLLPSIFQHDMFEVENRIKSWTKCLHFSYDYYIFTKSGFWPRKIAR